MRIKRVSARLTLHDRRRQQRLYPPRWDEPIDWFIAKTYHARYGELHASRRETTSVDTLGGYIFSTGENESNDKYYTWYSVATCNYWSTTEEIYYIEWKVSLDYGDDEWLWRDTLPWDIPMPPEVNHSSPTERYCGDIDDWGHCYDPGPMWV